MFEEIREESSPHLVPGTQCQNLLGYTQMPEVFWPLKPSDVQLTFRDLKFPLIASICIVGAGNRRSIQTGPQSQTSWAVEACCPFGFWRAKREKVKDVSCLWSYLSLLPSLPRVFPADASLLKACYYHLPIPLQLIPVVRTQSNMTSKLCIDVEVQIHKGHSSCHLGSLSWKRQTCK